MNKWGKKSFLICLLNFSVFLAILPIFRCQLNLPTWWLGHVNPSHAAFNGSHPIKVLWKSSPSLPSFVKDLISLPESLLQLTWPSDVIPWEVADLVVGCMSTWDTGWLSSPASLHPNLQEVCFHEVTVVHSQQWIIHGYLLRAHYEPTAKIRKQTLAQNSFSQFTEPLLCIRSWAGTEQT